MSMQIDPTDVLAQVLPFGSHSIGPSQPVVIIAEIGINHEGNIQDCIRMVEAAAEAGADAVKLQTIDAAENYVPGTLSHDLFTKAALSREDTARAFILARNLGMEVFTTAGDFATLDWVDQLDPAAHKISSGLLTHLPLVEYAAKTGKTLLLSTGMGGVEQVDAAVAVIQKAGGSKVGIFQCTSIYPAPVDSLNLRRMTAFGSRYGVPVGFSDHTEGDEAAVVAVGAGAKMIEKHFTLNKTRPSFDHGLSLEPGEFADLVVAVRRAESMLGDGEGVATREQCEAAKVYQRSLVAKTDIGAGEIFSSKMIGFMRTLPGEQGLAPVLIELVLGKTAACKIKKHTALTSQDVVGMVEKG